MAQAMSDKIVRSIEVKAPRERVWRAISTTEFGAWFGVKFLDGSMQPGSRVKVVSTHKGYEGTEFYMDLVEMEAPRRMSWRWTPGAKDNEVQTLVEFVLEETKGGTRITITESGFDRLSLEYRAKAFEENSGGWDYQIQSLARYLGENA